MAKTVGKPPEGTPNAGPTQDELQTAYQVHTLAQMLYGHMATVHPMPMGQVADPWAQQGWPTSYGGPFGHVGPAGFYWTGPSHWWR